MSGLLMPVGNIAKKQTHAPIAQTMLISFDERRLIILIIRGMFQRGRIIPAIKAIFCSIIMPCLRCLRHARFCVYTVLLVHPWQGQGIYAGQIPLG